MSFECLNRFFNEQHSISKAFCATSAVNVSLSHSGFIGNISTNSTSTYCTNMPTNKKTR